ncbi:YHYH protein [Aureibaculum luteum]|uniref:YHYH protein n=1 Tax=Aureibaculum luteum TaxID=1548456 RepID=UPI000E53A5D5|nr:YHYH protein [Aureibaculum luteum]
MGKIYSVVAIILAGVIVSCSSQKNTFSATTETVSVGKVPHIHNDYFGSYDLEDEIFGTKTIVTVTANERKMVTNSLPNHKTGQFPNKGNPNTIAAQNKTYTFPLSPKYIGEPTWVREPGIALNGVKFEPGTAEVVVCDTGESYRVEAFQDLISLGLDFNHAHVQPTGAYHYHGAPTSVIEDFDTGEDLVHVGFAKDGFPIYFSKTNAYKPSYKLLVGEREGEDCTYTNPMNSIDVSVADKHDGTYTSDFEYVEGVGDLDECNGITINGNYMYMVTTDFPYVSRCLMGEMTEEEHQGPPRGQQPVGQGKRPSATQIVKQMDVNNDEKLSKEEVKGPLLEQFDQVDSDKDGFITKEELESADKDDKQGPGNRKRPVNQN